MGFPSCFARRDLAVLDFFPTSLRSYGPWPRDVASLHAHEEASGKIWWTVMGFPSCFARRDKLLALPRQKKVVDRDGLEPSTR